MFCEREPEVLDLIRAGRSPEECETLAGHVRSCGACMDLVVVASTMLSDERSAVRIPSSGVMWWRAQRRARQEGATVTRRAMTLVQAITVIAGALVAIPLIGVLLPDIDWTAFALQLVATPMGFSLALLLVVSVVLTPAVVYFATGRD